MCKETSAFLTIVYHKPTFTGLYIHWDSFCSKKQKLNLIKTLTHRTLIICSESKLDDEVEFIPGTLCNSGFPEDIVQSVIRDKISDFSKIKPNSVQRYPIYLRLSWLGDISDKFANQISAYVLKCYFSSTHGLFSHLVEKTFFPQHSRSLIYSFTYVCRLQYILRTNQCLDSRIKHVPTKIRQGNYFADRINNTYRSSIAEHLINNCNCASSNSVDLFTILRKSHSDYHLKVLETIHIFTHKLSLCKQRECLLGLNLISI